MVKTPVRALAALAIVFVAAGGALAQGWPNRPIRMIVPYTPEIVEQGIVAVGGTPEEFRSFVAEEIVRWRKVITDAGIKMEQ